MMGMSLQNSTALLVFLVFLFSLNPQPSVCSSSSNAILPNNSPLMFCHPLQSHALLLFKSTFTIHRYASYGYCSEDISYPKTESWKEGTDCCSSWDGVTCDDVTGHVIGLDLSCSHLEGTIHSNNTLFSSHIAPHLQRLNLAGNFFFGSEISSEFGVKFGSSLTHLNLSHSGFGGNISSEISHMSNLVSLDLAYNRDLRVESNRVLENIAGNLTHLRVLNLDGLDMSSLHASSLMNLSSTSLTSLTLYNCQLQGEFPVSFLLFPNLEELDLSYNNFNPVTSLPYLNSTSGNLTHLRVLHLDEVDMSALHASSLMNLSSTSLTSLHLSGCYLQGEFPVSFLLYPNLEELDLSYNNFNPVTSLPYFNSTSSNLLFLDLTNTTFSLSSSIALVDFVGNDLKSLSRLYLSACNIIGPIPPSFGNLTQLTDLDLSYNHLSGPIPSFISNLTHLTYLDMRENELEGLLPSFLFHLPSLTTLVLSHNKLYGPFPSSPIKSVQFIALSLSHNNISSPTTNIDTNLNYSLPNFRSLDLSSCNFNQFPAFMKALTNLRYLHISNNQIQGPIPEWMHSVGKDTLSVIDFSENLLTVGSQIHWKNIQFIDLHSNLLQGSLPILPTTTQFFSASHNNLSGEVSSVFCNLSSINFIDLSHNQFTGSIPKCLGRLSNLSVLNLGMNNLHGVIPNSFTKNNSLNYLVLRRNNFTGKLPTSLVYCQLLQILDVGNNLIEDIFPYWLDRLTALEILVLRSNKFSGSLLEFKGEFLFPMVRILDLSNNRFTGGLPKTLIMNLNLTAKLDEKLGYGSQYMEILSNHYSYDSNYYLLRPTGTDIIIYMFATSDLYYPMVITTKGLETEYKKPMSALAIIDLSRNKFVGHIPEMIGKLVFLNGLNLSHNLLTGHIPSPMGDLVNLESLDLSCNELTGKIPTRLVDLTFLEVLNFSHNRLYGPIPQGKQFNTFKNDSYMDNLALCGFPLSKSCGEKSADSKEKDLLDSEGGFSWEGAFAGYGCGVVFGLCMGYVLFKKRSPKWLVRMVEGKQQRGRAGRRPKRGGRRRT